LVRSAFFPRSLSPAALAPVGRKASSAKRTGGRGLGAAKRLSAEGGPVEGVWGNREVPPAELGAEPGGSPSELGCGRERHQSLISMSMPAGRSSRISWSIVLGVGLRMSIRLLRVSPSKCSRVYMALQGI